MLDHSPKEVRGVFAGPNLQVLSVRLPTRTKLVLSGELDLASASTVLEAVDKRSVWATDADDRPEVSQLR